MVAVVICGGSSSSSSSSSRDSCLRHCATSRKITGSIAGGVIGIFH